MIPLRVTGDLRNVHLYSNSIEAIKKQIARPLLENHSPQLMIQPDISTRLRRQNVDAFDCMNIADFQLLAYDPEDSIKVEMLARD